MELQIQLYFWINSRARFLPVKHFYMCQPSLEDLKYAVLGFQDGLNILKTYLLPTKDLGLYSTSLCMAPSGKFQKHVQVSGIFLLHDFYFVIAGPSWDPR